MFHSFQYPKIPATDQIARGWQTTRSELFQLVTKATVAVWDAVLFLVAGLLFALSHMIATALAIIAIPLALGTVVALIVLAASGSVVLFGTALELLGVV